MIYALFPDAICYERHPSYSSPETSWTRAELETSLKRWRSYGYEDLIEIYGGAGNLPGIMAPNGDDIPYMDYWAEQLQYYEDLLTRVPEENQRPPTLWHMFKETEYHVAPEEASRMDLSQDRDCIQANVQVGDSWYYYVAANGNPLGGSTNLISLSFNPPDSPANIDWQIHLTENDSIPAPTQEDLANAKARAQELLDILPFGQWVVASIWPSDHDHTIYIDCDPAEGDFPVARDVVYDLGSYQVPDLSIRIRPDGTLLNLQISGSFTDITTLTQNPAELPLDTLLDTALNHLKAADTMAYGISEDNLRYAQVYAEEDFTADIQVTRAVRGYVRMNTGTGTICNDPCFALMGSDAYSGKESGQVCDRRTFYVLPNGELTLVLLNAIDGSIIPMQY